MAPLQKRVCVVPLPEGVRWLQAGVLSFGVSPPPLEKGGEGDLHRGGGLLKSYNPVLKPYARRLRSNMTDAEHILWRHLRRKQVCGVSFYRQKPLLSFIVDFYCPKARLVIELDGSQHFESGAVSKDYDRDAALASLGLWVLRFDNHQVLTMLESVLTVIHSEVAARLVAE